MTATIVYREDGEDGGYYGPDALLKAAGDPVYWEPEAITTALKSFDLPFKVYEIPETLWDELVDNGMNGMPRTLEELPLEKFEDRTNRYVG